MDLRGQQSVHYHASPPGGRICLQVHSSVEKWFLNTVKHSKMEAEDFVIYLLLVYGQINTSAPTMESSIKVDKSSKRSKKVGQALHVDNQSSINQDEKYAELTPFTLANEISSVVESFPSKSKVFRDASIDMIDVTPSKSSPGMPEMENSQNIDCSASAAPSKGKVTSLQTELEKSTQKRMVRSTRKKGVRSSSTKSKFKGDSLGDVTVKQRGRPLKLSSPVLCDSEHPDRGVGSGSRTNQNEDIDSARSGKQHDYILHKKDKDAVSLKRKYVYECRLCQKLCQGWSSWYHHRSTHLENRADFVCPTCGWKTKTKAGMWAHRKKHGVIQEKCPHCTYTNSVKREVAKHVKQTHGDGSNVKRKHLCDTCGREFRSSSSLSAHLKLHKELIRDQVCEVCSKTFYSKKLVKDHMRTVHEDKRYACDQCEKKFSKGRSLRVHIDRVHLKIKEIPCSYDGCGQLFCEKKDLVQHIMVYHTKEKKYKCQWDGCGKTFRTHYHRKIHMRLHTGEKPIKCPHCEYTARQRNSLLHHLKRHAEDDQDVTVQSKKGDKLKKAPHVIDPSLKTVNLVANVEGERVAGVSEASVVSSSMQQVSRETEKVPSVTEHSPQTVKVVTTSSAYVPVCPQSEHSLTSASSRSIGNFSQPVNTDLLVSGADLGCYKHLSSDGRKQHVTGVPDADLDKHKFSVVKLGTISSNQSAVGDEACETLPAKELGKIYRTLSAVNLGEQASASPVTSRGKHSDTCSNSLVGQSGALSADVVDDLVKNMPGVDPGKGSGPFKATVFSVGESGKTAFTATVLELPQDDYEKSAFPTVPVLDTHPELGDPPTWFIQDITPNFSGSSAMTLPVFTAEELMNAASEPLIPPQLPVQVSGMLPISDKRMDAPVAGQTVSAAEKEPARYLSIPIFPESGGIPVLKAQPVTPQEQRASVVKVFQKEGSSSLVATGETVKTSNAAFSRTNVDRPSRRRNIRTAASATSKAEGADTASPFQSVRNSSSLDVGALSQVNPSLQDVELHHLMQQQQPPVTTSSS